MDWRTHVCLLLIVSQIILTTCSMLGIEILDTHYRDAITLLAGLTVVCYYLTRCGPLRSHEIEMDEPITSMDTASLHTELLELYRTGVALSLYSPPGTLNSSELRWTKKVTWLLRDLVELSQPQMNSLRRWVQK